MGNAAAGSAGVRIMGFREIGLRPTAIRKTGPSMMASGHRTFFGFYFETKNELALV
jgi:hypothetical protein